MRTPTPARRRLVAHRAADLHPLCRAARRPCSRSTSTCSPWPTPSTAPARRPRAARRHRFDERRRAGLPRPDGGARAAAGLAGGAGGVKTRRSRRPHRFDSAAGEPPRVHRTSTTSTTRTVGASAQAQHVFLPGNGLPARWAGRALLHDPGDRLRPRQQLPCHLGCLAATTRHAASGCSSSRSNAIRRARDDLARAHAASPWPALAPAAARAPGRRWHRNLHPIDFDDGRVRLLLACGDVRRAAACAASAGRRLLPGRLCARAQPGDVGAAAGQGHGSQGRTRRHRGHLERGA